MKRLPQSACDARSQVSPCHGMAVTARYATRRQFIKGVAAVGVAVVLPLPAEPQYFMRTVTLTATEVMARMELAPWKVWHTSRILNSGIAAIMQEQNGMVRLITEREFYR